MGQTCSELNPKRGDISDFSAAHLLLGPAGSRDRLIAATVRSTKSYVTVDWILSSGIPTQQSVNSGILTLPSGDSVCSMHMELCVSASLPYALVLGRLCRQTLPHASFHLSLGIFHTGQQPRTLSYYPALNTSGMNIDIPAPVARHHFYVPDVAVPVMSLCGLLCTFQHVRTPPPPRRKTLLTLFGFSTADSRALALRGPFFRDVPRSSITIISSINKFHLIFGCQQEITHRPAYSNSAVLRSYPKNSLPPRLHSAALLGSGLSQWMLPGSFDRVQTKEPEKSLHWAENGNCDQKKLGQGAGWAGVWDMKSGRVQRIKAGIIMIFREFPGC
ncbi:hypothetical protein B0H13DRAFT_1867648 [Mycena leptocephala]|nr:hypothetical protein B0H13DRAFT_1867648 [Mycena leptocephala]